jgi:PiT family inorganic phosphate transporter
VVAGVAAALVLVLAATATGFPVSSSHALVGGLVGAGLAAGGAGALILPSREAVIALLAFTFLGFTAGAALASAAALLLREPVPLALLAGGTAGGCVVVPLALAAGMLHLTAIGAILVFLVVSPCLAFFAALGLDILISHLFRFSRQPVMRRIFQPFQVAAGAFQAAGTGSNNSQHGAGVIAALLLAGSPPATLPLGITAASAAALALGTMAGGWRVVEVVARKITRIRPYQGFAAGLAGGLVITATTLSGIPTSSTHAMDGSIVGVGATRGLRAVHWDAVREIVAAWIVTIPVSLLCGWILALVTRASGV